MTAARKLAVVTGGASGIGRATVERLAGDGFALAVLDLDGDEAARSAKAAGDDGLGLAADVSNQGSVERAFAPVMLERRSGHVITVASAAGIIAFPGRCAYTASKGAAVLFTKSLAVDYAASGIRANAVCPGMAETPMTSWRLDVPELRARVEAGIPMGRVAQPEEIADAIALLASDHLAYMTGHALVLDGGWTAL